MEASRRGIDCFLKRAQAQARTDKNMEQCQTSAVSRRDHWLPLALFSQNNYHYNFNSIPHHCTVAFPH